MPSFSYKTTADHVQLKRIDDITNSFSEMAWLVADLKERGYDNIKVVRTDLATGEQTNLLVV